MRSFVLLTVCMAAMTACSRTPEGLEYSLQGQILSVNADHTEASIKHDDIKGFMPAMTMPYHVREAKEFSAVKPGDLIAATLVVVSNDAYLKNVRKLGSAPIETPPEDTIRAPSGPELLKPGEEVPNAQFVDENGRRRDFASLGGSTVVLTFIYTRCPMPDFCPLMDRHFKDMQEHIKADPALKGVRLLSISFDPITDTPAVLKAHGRQVGADPNVWTFFTGDQDEIDRFARRFGVSITREDTVTREITHNLRTAIVSPKGVLVKNYTGNDWTPDQVIADLKNSAG